VPAHRASAPLTHVRFHSLTCASSGRARSPDSFCGTGLTVAESPLAESPLVDAPALTDGRPEATVSAWLVRSRRTEDPRIRYRRRALRVGTNRSRPPAGSERRSVGEFSILCGSLCKAKSAASRTDLGARDASARAAGRDTRFDGQSEDLRPSCLWPATSRGPAPRSDGRRSDRRVRYSGGHGRSHRSGPT